MRLSLEATSSGPPLPSFAGRLDERFAVFEHRILAYLHLHDISTEERQAIDVLSLALQPHSTAAAALHEHMRPDATFDDVMARLRDHFLSESRMSLEREAALSSIRSRRFRQQGRRSETVAELIDDLEALSLAASLDRQANKTWLANDESSLKDWPAIHAKIETVETYEQALQVALSWHSELHNDKRKSTATATSRASTDDDQSFGNLVGVHSFQQSRTDDTPRASLPPQLKLVPPTPLQLAQSPNIAFRHSLDATTVRPTSTSDGPRTYTFHRFEHEAIPETITNDEDDRIDASPRGMVDAPSGGPKRWSLSHRRRDSEPAHSLHRLQGSDSVERHQRHQPIPSAARKLVRRSLSSSARSRQQDRSKSPNSFASGSGTSVWSKSSSKLGSILHLGRSSRQRKLQGVDEAMEASLEAAAAPPVPRAAQHAAEGRPAKSRGGAVMDWTQM